MSEPSTEARPGAGLWTLVRMVPRYGTWLTTLLAVGVIVAAVSPVATRVAAGILVGSVPEAVERGWGSDAGQRLVAALIVVAALYVVGLAVGEVSRAVATVLGHRLHGDLRVRVMAAACRPPGVGQFEDPEQMRAVSLARNVAPGMFQPSSAVVGLTVGTGQRLAILVAVVVTATYAWWLALALLAVSAAAQVLLWRLFFESTGVITGKQVDLARAVYFRDLALTPHAAKETRIFGLPPWIATRYLGAARELIEPVWQQRRQGWRRVALSCVLLGGAEVAAYVWVGWAGVHGHLSLEDVSVLIGTIALALNAPVSDADLSAAYGASSIPDVLALEESVAAGAADPPATGSIVPRQCIRLEGVAFSYRAADPPVFSGLNLEIPAGQRLAIVGANGAGKTTLIKLLARLYTPTAGRITVDGVDLAAVSPRSWLREMSVLFQDYVHYALPATDNVGFGASALADDRDALERAARRAGADGVIANLPDGWDTVLSRSRTGGADLSAGQWQRVALARALLAVDAGARVLVLDEPTANLDVRGEAEVYDWLLHLAASAELGDGAPLTTILISHRFSTVRGADRIVVLDRGAVVEDGTHEELLARGGRYAAMFEAQASRFRDEPSLESLDPLDGPEPVDA